jgi:hypothetical protein
MTIMPAADESTDSPPPIEGNWTLVKDSMQLPAPMGWRLANFPDGQIWDALQTLNPLDRDIIERTYFRKQSFHDVAWEKRTTPYNVWSVHHQAICRLRAALAKLQSPASPSPTPSVS